MTPFTVLQSVYKSDSPAFLDESLQSIAGNTLQPVCVVLVKDGMLTPELLCAELRAAVCAYGACRPHGQ